MPPVRAHRSFAGFTLVELLAGLAVTVIAIASLATAARALGRRAELAASRRCMIATLRDARRQAYLSRDVTEVAVHEGDRELRVRAGGRERTIPLPYSAYVARAPSSGRIRFFASGLASNATVELAGPDGGPRTSVVINQRGRIR